MANAKPADLLAYVQHKRNCDALQPMWHKGPCDCGLTALLKQMPAWIKPHLGPGAVICTTCDDKVLLESGEPCPNCDAGRIRAAVIRAEAEL